MILCLVSVRSKKVANRMEAKYAKERMAGYEVRERGLMSNSEDFGFYSEILKKSVGGFQQRTKMV